MKIIKIACCNDCPYLKRCSPESQMHFCFKNKSFKYIYDVTKIDENCDLEEFIL